MNTKEKMQFEQIFNKYIEWKKSQEGQVNGYEFEKSFEKFCRQMNQDLFKLAVEGEHEEKKVITSYAEVSVAKSHCLAPQGRKGFRVSKYLQQKACYLGQQLSFDSASETLLKIGGISLSAR